MHYPAAIANIVNAAKEDTDPTPDPSPTREGSGCAGCQDTDPTPNPSPTREGSGCAGCQK